MKKVLFLIFVLAGTLTIQAQGLRIGAVGGPTTTWLFNQNVSDYGDELDYASTFSGGGGLSVIYSFAEAVGVSLELMYSGHNQKFTGVIGSGNGSVSYDGSLNLSYFDIPLLFRLQSPKGPYFEIGGQLGSLLGAKESIQFSPADPLFDYADRNVKENMNNLNLAGVFGFGVDIAVTDKINVKTGLRFGYGFSDVTKEFSLLELGEKTADGSLSYYDSVANVDKNGNLSYQKTNRAYGAFMLGINYLIWSNE